MAAYRFARRLLCLCLALMLAIPALALAESEQEPGQELLKDADFSGPLRFMLYTESGGAAKLSIVDGELQVDVTSAGRVEHAIQPYYDGFKLIQGVTYELSWDARSTVPRRMQVRIQLNGGDYHAYVMEIPLVTEEMQHYAVTFTMEEPTDPAPRLCVNMGLVADENGDLPDAGTLSGQQVYFDNFSLKVVDAGGAVAEAEDPDARGVRVNQVGYTPDADKIAVLAGLDYESDAFFVIVPETGEMAYEGTLGEAVDNAWAGEVNRIADFSAFAGEGVFVIETVEGDRSPEFTVGEDVYGDLLRQSLRMLYLQRCGAALDGALAGDFAHAQCHTALAAVYGTDEKIDVSGGWHDAGDYGRYVVSGAKAAADLLLAHERCGGIDDAGIPESGDGVSDLLQEAQYELEWMLKMQRQDGGVYHKVTCRNFPAFVAPEEETDELVVCPVSNTATGDFAAVMAMAARIFAESGDAALAERASAYTEAAERAWAYLVDHQGDPGFTNPADVVTGEYPDDHDADEYFWAAAELARTTGNGEYHDAAAAFIDAACDDPNLGWVNVAGYGLYAVAMDSGLAEGDSLREDAAQRLAAVAQKALDTAALNPYGVDRTDTYEWGSNMGIANTGAMLQMAAEALGEEAYARAAQSWLDYLLGKNATGYCFVTAFGAKSPEHPHHRPSTVAGYAMPAMLVGGPDSGLDDPYAANALADNAPAKRYGDSDQSYSTNEVCVYWNSPLVLLLAGM